MPKEISYHYQLEQSISVLRNVWWYLSFYSNFERTFCKQAVETLIRQNAASDLGLHYLLMLCPTKRMLCFYRAFYGFIDILITRIM